MDFRLHPSSKGSAQDWPLKSPKATVRKHSISTVVILSHLEPGCITPDCLVHAHCTTLLRNISALLPWYDYGIEYTLSRILVDENEGIEERKC